MKFKIFAAVVLSFFAGSHAFSQTLPGIETGKKVTLHYTLKVDKKVVDSTLTKEPLSFVYGEAALIPGFEKALLGLKTGDKKSLTLAPEEAYGPVNPKAVAKIPKSHFPKQKIKRGMTFTSQTPEGNEIQGTVKKVSGGKVHLDFNHPLAGKSLHLDIEILSVE